MLALAGTAPSTWAQELYVSSEPASNMAANSAGLRLTNKFIRMEDRTGMRFEPELMLAVSKELMIHTAGFVSNNMQDNMRFEGGSIYAKYRFLSNDAVHAHFRMAAYLRGALIDNPYGTSSELDLEGMTSGLSGGLVATQLVHKLAVSATLGYDRYMNNTQHKIPDHFSRNAMAYSLSAGYLLLPFEYKSYEQTNMNLYVEFLGKSNLDRYKGNYYVDVAPALQFIFSSTTRLDLSYRFPLAGDMARNIRESVLVRLEHNIFGIR